MPASIWLKCEECPTVVEDGLQLLRYKESDHPVPSEEGSESKNSEENEGGGGARPRRLRIKSGMEVTCSVIELQPLSIKLPRCEDKQGPSPNIEMNGNLHNDWMNEEYEGSNGFKARNPNQSLSPGRHNHTKSPKSKPRAGPLSKKNSPAKLSLPSTTNNRKGYSTPQKKGTLWICDYCGMSCKTISGLRSHEGGHEKKGHPRQIPECQPSTSKGLQFDLYLNVWPSAVDEHKANCPKVVRKGKEFDSETENEIENMEFEDDETSIISSPEASRAVIAVAEPVQGNSSKKFKPTKQIGRPQSKVWKVGDKNKVNCEYCDKPFHRSDYARHLRTHTGEKPFACKYELCEKKFADSSARLKHQRVCPLRLGGDEMEVTSPSTIKQRRRKDIKCEVCGLNVKFKKLLAIHMRVHEKKKATRPTARKSTNFRQSIHRRVPSELSPSRANLKMPMLQLQVTTPNEDNSLEMHEVPWPMPVLTPQVTIPVFPQHPVEIETEPERIMVEESGELEEDLEMEAERFAGPTRRHGTDPLLPKEIQGGTVQMPESEVVTTEDNEEELNLDTQTQNSITVDSGLDMEVEEEEMEQPLAFIAESFLDLDEFSFKTEKLESELALLIESDMEVISEPPQLELPPSQDFELPPESIRLPPPLVIPTPQPRICLEHLSMGCGDCGQLVNFSCNGFPDKHDCSAESNEAYDIEVITLDDDEEEDVKPVVENDIMFVGHVRKNPCGFCGRGVSEDDLDKHIAQLNSEDWKKSAHSEQVICRVCRVELKSEDQLAQHVRILHPDLEDMLNDNVDEDSVSVGGSGSSNSLSSCPGPFTDIPTSSSPEKMTLNSEVPAVRLENQQSQQFSAPSKETPPKIFYPGYNDNVVQGQGQAKVVVSLTYSPQQNPEAQGYIVMAKSISDKDVPLSIRTVFRPPTKPKPSILKKSQKTVSASTAETSKHLRTIFPKPFTTATTTNVTKPISYIPRQIILSGNSKTTIIVGKTPVIQPPSVNALPAFICSPVQKPPTVSDATTNASADLTLGQETQQPEANIEVLSQNHQVDSIEQTISNVIARYLPKPPEQNIISPNPSKLPNREKQGYSSYSRDIWQSCRICNKLIYKNVYMSHIQEHEQVAALKSLYPFRCNYCPDRFVKECFYFDHMKALHPGIVFSTVMGRKNHEVRDHPSKDFLCEECGSRFESQEKLDLHKIRAKPRKALNET